MPNQMVSKQSRGLLEALMIHIPEGLIVVSAPDLTVTAISELGSVQFGQPRSAIEGQPLQALVSRYRLLTPTGQAVALDDLPIVRASRSGETIGNEQWIMEDEQGNQITVMIDAGPVLGPNGAVVGAVSSWADISALKALESDLRQSLDDGSVLLDEAQHRFRNHLQMLSTFAAAEAQRTGATAPSVAKAMGNRLAALGSAQGAFQGEKDEGFNGANLLESVCRVLDSDAHPVKCCSDPTIELGKDQITPLALVVNEGVVNALKHAFPEGRPGSIYVSLNRTDGDLSLEIADDGVGLSQQPRQGAMGLRIVDNLARQLRGEKALTNRPEGGSVLRITFPV